MQICSVWNNLPQLSTAELLPGPEVLDGRLVLVGNNLPQLSAAELLPGLQVLDARFSVCGTICHS